VSSVTHALEESRRTGTGVGLLYVDLDHFKPVNDRWGHAVGDRLLAAAAERMRSVVGPEHLVARMGGDEFVVLVRHLSTPRTAVVLAGHLHRAVTAPYVLREAVVSVGASIGTVVAPAGATAEGLISLADEALYAAKATGRNRVHDAAAANWTPPWLPPLAPSTSSARS
jgi:diguanylate cyclase (GGDEF)-like protein